MSEVYAVRAGDLRRRITIEQRASTQDSSMQRVETWSTFATCWAEIRPLQGRELQTAQAVAAETTHELSLRYRAGVTPAMRVAYQGRIFDITAVMDPDTRHRRLTLLCSEGLNQG